MALRGFVLNFSDRVKALAVQAGRIGMLDMYTAIEQLEVLEERLNTMGDELDDILAAIGEEDNNDASAIRPYSDTIN